MRADARRLEFERWMQRHQRHRPCSHSQTGPFWLLDTLKDCVTSVGKTVELLCGTGECTSIIPELESWGRRNVASSNWGIPGLNTTRSCFKKQQQNFFFKVVTALGLSWQFLEKHLLYMIWPLEVEKEVKIHVHKTYLSTNKYRSFYLALICTYTMAKSKDDYTEWKNLDNRANTLYGAALKV